MSCYHPVRAWRYPVEGSSLHFTPQGAPYEQLEVPCGVCVGCRADQSLMWSIRAYHESMIHDRNCFVTLTYSDEHLPADRKIDKKELQDFFKRLRKKLPPRSMSYIACGEYGDDTRRPHYHAVLFGVDFLHDKITLDDKSYTSPTLSEIWGKGNVSISPVNMATICYVCGYVTKKIKDKDTFNLMSRRPAIGKRFLERFKSDMLATSSVTIEGKEYPVPKRYIEWAKDEFQDIIAQRQEYAKRNSLKNTDAVLKAKKLNRLARNSQKKGKL